MTDKFYLPLKIHSLLFFTLSPTLGSCMEYMDYIKGALLHLGFQVGWANEDLQQQIEGVRRMGLGYLFSWLSSCRVALGWLCPAVEGHMSSQGSPLLPTPFFWILDSRFSSFPTLLDSGNCSLSLCPFRPGVVIAAFSLALGCGWHLSYDFPRPYLYYV